MATDQVLDQQANATFWDNWCQSYNSGDIVLDEITPSALEGYDRGYLDYYPYLLRRIRVDDMRGQRVLEVGLGFGTLGQKIVEAGADYLGMDVAGNSVDLMNHRMQLHGLSGEAVQGNFLSNDLPGDAFDVVVSVGCFHHTGDLARCVQETYRVLRSGGSARIMIYNRFSLRQWANWPWMTLRALLGEDPDASTAQRRTYDCSDGEAAPITEFTSTRQAKALFRRFADVNIHKENCDDIRLLGKTLLKRKTLLGVVGPWLGLDLYLDARK